MLLKIFYAELPTMYHEYDYISQFIISSIQLGQGVLWVGDTSRMQTWKRQVWIMQETSFQWVFVISTSRAFLKRILQIFGQCL